ncbi:MAG: accessory gene regulator B family protein [Lachnospiraceae bacterium]|nr:accessory gene regulator B family protein [Lachnospiraceae bacterium]
MEQFKRHLKDTYHLSSYQIAQIFFLFETIISEMSKILIMGVAFHNHLPLYFFALFMMIFLRSAMGGLHFYTYAGCLLTSFVYIWAAIWLLPHITIAKYLQLILSVLCIVICNHIGPIISKYRPEACKEHFSQCKRFITIFIFFYTLILYVMPKNKYLTVGFWVIILHSLQLIIAKIQTKGESVK